MNPFKSKVVFSATEPSPSNVGGISADRREKHEWSKEGEFKSLQTATDASTYHWVRNKIVGWNSKRTRRMKVLIKGCNSYLALVSQTNTLRPRGIA